MLPNAKIKQKKKLDFLCILIKVKPMSSVLIGKSGLYCGVKQFTIFIDQQHVSLNNALSLINANGLTLLAFSSDKIADCLILRAVTNYTDKFKELLEKNGIYFSERPVLAVEFLHSNDIVKIIDVITSAEIKVHYFYPMLSQHSNKLGSILCIEDINLGAKALSQTGITVISQNELDR